MMWFRLAALWGCPVREAMRRCSQREFIEWCAFHDAEGIGEWREVLDVLFSRLRKTILDPHTPRHKRLDPDQYRVFRKIERYKTHDEVISIIRAAKRDAAAARGTTHGRP